MPLLYVTEFVYNVGNKYNNTYNIVCELLQTNLRFINLKQLCYCIYNIQNIT